MPNRVWARSRARPASSSAAMVLSKVGAADWPAILAISARFSSMAAWKAGAKSSTLILSKAGTPP